MQRSINLKAKEKIVIGLFLFIFGFIIISIKLFYVQIIKGSEYSLAANEQLNASRSINANRGIIYDSNR